MKKMLSCTTPIKTHEIRVSDVTRLLFEWPIKKAPRLTLPLFIFLAVLLHLSAVYFFNIVYEPLHVRKITTAQVYFLIPKSQASQQIAPWLQANDPAIFSPLETIQKNEPKRSNVIYQLSPSIPVLHHLPPCKEESTAPLLPPTDECLLPRESLVLQDASSRSQVLPLKSTLSRTTRIQLQANLVVRIPEPASVLGHPILPLSSSIPAQPTLLTVNIDAMGIPRHVIITQSSQNEEADEVATHWLMTRHFAPSNEATWGNILIFWGHE